MVQPTPTRYHQTTIGCELGVRQTIAQVDSASRWPLTPILHSAEPFCSPLPHDRRAAIPKLKLHFIGFPPAGPDACAICTRTLSNYWRGTAMTTELRKT